SQPGLQQTSNSACPSASRAAAGTSGRVIRPRPSEGSKKRASSCDPASRESTCGFGTGTGDATGLPSSRQAAVQPPESAAVTWSDKADIQPPFLSSEKAKDTKRLPE